jgi:ethanolamine transporter EutH
MDQKHSRIGVVSFVIALANCLLTLLIVVLSTQVRGFFDFEGVDLIARLLVVGLIGCVVGLGLGLAALEMTDRRHVLSRFGIILNAVSLLCLIIRALLGPWGLCCGV